MAQRIRAGAASYQSSPARASLTWVLLVLLLALIGAGLWAYWRAPERLAQVVQAMQQLAGQQAPSSADPELAPEALANEAATPVPATDPLALAPIEPEHPIELPELEQLTLQPLPSLESSDSAVSHTLTDWLGAQPTQQFIQNDRFVRRFVATVDNLTAPRAPALMWPVRPTDPRFTVEASSAGSDTHIAAANSARYTPAVQLAQRIDTGTAARHYRQYYPLFQQAYEELGYPNRYFNDRLVEVIDHLLQAPEPVAPRVRLAQLRTSDGVASQQPWVRYEFEDARLEALSAGQKILVRMGPANARVIKTKLREFRAQIAQGGTNAPTPTETAAATTNTPPP